MDYDTFELPEEIDLNYDKIPFDDFDMFDISEGFELSIRRSVPIPSSFLMLITGLAGLAVFGRKF